MDPMKTRGLEDTGVYFQILSCPDLSAQLQRLPSHYILQHPIMGALKGACNLIALPPCVQHGKTKGALPLSLWLSLLYFHLSCCQPSSCSRFRALKCSTVLGIGAGTPAGDGEMGKAGALPQCREWVEGGAHPNSRSHCLCFAALDRACFV